ncbi:hypothetical protein RHMOL_Rhmol07G0084700 [Rhododendron molle]|uniref:Uncharacterized protein n=1 Tax=Rhododendron molle TaxID=49168 RepID=A0ACC0MZL5_RHOML|nr:hypothetical protein RHMOL_Rhmol07G0084700 [Rhododendron molle]
MDVFSITLPKGVRKGPAMSFRDRAWAVVSRRGAAAWVWVGDHGLEVAAQVDLYFASLAALVEIRAGLAALQWASAQGILEVCIQTDNFVFVHGLCNPQGAATSV